jgi:hypothetical protein
MSTKLRSTRRRFLATAARALAFAGAVLGTSGSILNLNVMPAAAGTSCSGCAGPCFICDQGCPTPPCLGCCFNTITYPDGSTQTSMCCACGQTFARMPYVNQCSNCDCLCGSLACN